MFDKLEHLKELKRQKRSREWYAAKLKITLEEIDKLNLELMSMTESQYKVKSQHIVEEEVNHTAGTRKVTIESDRALSPQEIEKLAGVDNITTFVDRHWLKSHKNNTWTYSILVINKTKDFYTGTALDEKLKDIFKDVSPAFKAEIEEDEYKRKALFVYIADDHAGLTLKDSLFKNDYSGTIYAKRLQKVVQEIVALEQVFDSLYIVRMGDEMDGWNAKTTRYDHDLDSLSNKEQFDIYTVANKLFYDSIFTKRLAKNYHIVNLENSNHTGKGFSYIANKALEFWMEAKFPEVVIKHQSQFIDIITFGNHVIGLTHGKDEKYMKSPMPLNIDFKTDAFLMEYYRKQGIDNTAFISTVKADIHKFNLTPGKSGRYVNVPSIAGVSNWIEHNFGDTDAGVLLEIYTDDSKNIVTMPIWFQ